MSQVQEVLELLGAIQVLPLDVVEKQAIVHAIRALNGNLSLVARTLGVGRATLYRKLAQYDITSVHTDGGEAAE